MTDLRALELQQRPLEEELGWGFLDLDLEAEFRLEHLDAAREVRDAREHQRVNLSSALDEHLCKTP